MLKRVSGAGLILFVLICAACSRNKAPALPQSTQPSDAYVESVNTVSGTYTIDAVFNENKQPAVVNISQAYARVIGNPEDRNKKDVLIVLVEQPLPRFALSIIEDEDDVYGTAAVDFDDMLGNRDARGVILRVATDRNAAGAEKDQIRQFFHGQYYDFGKFELQLQVSADKVDGHIKSNEASKQADITFAVKLQPGLWTGGTFYQLPPTNLSPGQASGQLEIDDRVVKLNHAYARLIEFDLFDETKNVYRVWLSEKPVDTATLGDYDMPQIPGNVALTFQTSEPRDRSQMSVWSGSQFDSVPDVERDYVKYGRDAIEGRVYSLFLVELRDRAYKMDLLFNATMLPSTATDGPVSASEGGKQLPADGGDPTKAYLAAVDRMKGVKNIDEGIATWTSLVTKDAAERIKKDIESLTGEQRQLVVDVFAPLENPKLTGALIKDNKATLRFSGTSKGEKAEEVVNMHLEDGQWKIGRREIRVD